MKWPIKKYGIFFIVGSVLPFNACIEPFDIQTSASFESALVIEATITNEEKQQLIKVSRAYPLDSGAPTVESNAQVRVVDDAQNEYVFNETEPGTYISEQVFAAVLGRSYRLSITTAEGRSYGSEPQVLAQGAEVANVYPIRETNDFGEDGVSIYLDATAPNGGSNYFRYEYEETFKIVVPLYSPQDVSVVNDQWPNFEYELVERTNGPVCFGNRVSTRVVLADTERQASADLQRFQITFLNADDYAISHRYSILVKQYAQSVSAYSYYETLRDFSQAENFFSDNQPGFLEGNVFSETDPDEKVIGFFDVSQVTTRRMFFNYEDLFPGEPLPPYVTSCGNGSVVAPSSGCPGMGGPGCIPPLINAIRDQSLVFFEQRTADNFTPAPMSSPGPYLMVPFNCGDCSKLGSTDEPEFWVE